MSALPPPPPPPPYPPAGPPPRSSGPRVWLIVAILAVVALVVAGAVTGLVLALSGQGSDAARHGPHEQSTPAGRTSTAPGPSESADPAVSDTDRTSATSFVQQSLETVLGYGPSAFDTQVDTAAGLMTPAYAAEYRTTMTNLRPVVIQQRTSLTVQVSETGLTGIATDSADVLAFVQQTTDRPGTSPQLTSSWVAVSLERSDGRWLIAGLDTTGSSALPTEPDPARRAAMDAARNLTTAMLDVDYRHPDRSSNQVLALSTGTFARQYRGSLARLTELMAQTHTVQTGRVLATGVSRFDADTAQVLVAATSQVSSTSSSNPQPRSYRIRMTMIRVAGQWRAAELAYVS